MIFGAALLVGCMGPPYPEGSIEQLFPQPPRPADHYYMVGDRRIHYVEMTGAAPARIIFIHGSPGDWKAWAGYLDDSTLRGRATLIAVDRPGFGDSQPGRVVPDLREQARLLEPLLRDDRVPTVVVGHSLGGPIAAELAMDYPAEVSAAVLIAPSIDPHTEQPRWYNRAMTWWLVRQLLPAEFEWSNNEIMPLAQELAAMEERWQSLTIPVIVIQGARDELVDPRTADFAQKVLPASSRVLLVPDQGHFVLWEKPAIVVDAIVDVLQKAQAARAHSDRSAS